MALATPFITTNNGESFSTNRSSLTLEGTCDPTSTEVQINGSTSGVSYTPGDSTWLAELSLVSGANVFTVQSQNLVDTSPTDAIAITLLTNADIALQVDSPTGLQLEQGISGFRISWVEEPDQDIRGYQVWYARSPGGGTTGYIKAHTVLITNPTELVEVTETISEDISTQSNVRTTILEESVSYQRNFRFVFNQLPNGGTLDDLPYYFVITAIAYDSTRRREIQSPRSEELFGELLKFEPKTNTFPIRSFSDVVGDMISKVLIRQPELDTKPLTLTRDVVIDPTADEYTRIYTLIDFVHHAQSLITLMAFDDPNGDGESDAFTPGLKKTALRDALLADDIQVQAVIDSAFDTLATNYTAEGRRAAEFARGQVTVYYEGTTVQAVRIPRGTVVATTANEELGVEAIEFLTTTDLNVSASEFNSYYNSTTRRYEFTLDIRARIRGAAGNVPANSIVNGNGLPSGFEVTNEESTDFGLDRETNQDLAVRALVGVAGVDTGTLYGYFRQAVSTPGVRRVRVVDAGHSLMKRDWSDTVGRHLAGAVDVYIQGKYFSLVNFEFAFTYPRVENEIVNVLDLTALRFAITNPDVGPSTPAFEILSFQNVTKVLTFDVTNAWVDTNGVTVTLDPLAGINSTYLAASSPTDQFRITYRYRESSTAEFSDQPVLQVVDVQGSISGDLNENYNLYQQGDPLIFGRSTQASDSIEIFPDGGKPADTFISQEDTLVLIGLDAVSLSKRGVVEDTIVVTNEAGTITYVLGVDYEVTSGTQFQPPQIARKSTVSAISDGQTVKVAYEVGENITVTYLTNSLLGAVDERINGTEENDYKDGTRHAAADVIIKSVLETPVNIRARIRVKSGFTQSAVRATIIGNLSTLIRNLELGESLNQDAVIRVILNTDGVEKVEIPLLIMGRQDEALVIREEIDDAVTWSVQGVGTATAWRTDTAVLEHPTIDGGGRKIQIGSGPGYVFGSVGGAQNEGGQLTAVDTVGEVADAPGNVFFGSDGKVTLSTVDGSDPNDSTSSFAVSYRVYSELGPADIPAGDLEVLVPGEISIDFLT